MKRFTKMSALSRANLMLPCKDGPLRAKGARYESQGQARSASPLVITNTRDQGLKGRNNTRAITPFQGSHVLLSVTRGDALRACPWLSYSAPLALSFTYNIRFQIQ